MYLTQSKTMLLNKNSDIEVILDFFYSKYSPHYMSSIKYNKDHFILKIFLFGSHPDYFDLIEEFHADCRQFYQLYWSHLKDSPIC